MGDSLEPAGPGDTVPDVAQAPVEKVINYLRRVVPVILEDGAENQAALDMAMADKGAVDLVRKFIGEASCTSLLVERVAVREEEEPGEGGEEKELVTYNITTTVHYTQGKMTSLVCLKKGPVIEGEKSIASQLRVISLSEGSAYETLHCYVSAAMAPYFKSFVRESGKADRDGDKMATSMEKKIAELEMGLLHLQQNIDIPEISLVVHPTVAQVIKRCCDDGVKAKVADFGDKVEDSTFLNALQNQVNKWIREIQKVTKLDRDPSSGTALQEISFWLNLERALLRIQEKRESVEVALTLDILKHGKRFHATVSFDTDTGLKQALATVNDYNPLMKDFPINDLLSATELDRIRTAVQGIFNHLRKIRNTKYPIQRALRLVEAISRDVSSQLLKVLGTRRLMYIPYEEFEKVMSQCHEVFTTWDDEYDKLQGLMRDIVKKKRDEHLKMVWRVNFSHKRLQERMQHMVKFRRQHEQLRTVIVRVLRPTLAQQVSQTHQLEIQQEEVKPEAIALEAADANAIEEVNLAYENVKEVDGLDITKEGSEAWEAAMKRYDERIDRVETRITARLRDQLGTAKNANEMFRIFSRFNALFVRPHIRGAIREYQTQLIQRVKDDIETLHEKFKVQYMQSKACKMSHVRDLPPVSGSIIWAKQIDRQLTAYMRRVEDVLGKGWANHVEGQKLKADGDSFRAKLNTQEIFDDWARKVQQRNLGVSGRIFAIENTRARTGRGNYLKLKVNFLPEIIQLSKEVRNLKNLGFRVPLAIVNKAHQANQLYPFAISLIESVRTYERSLEKMEARPAIVLLVAGLRKDVQQLISEGVGLVWESYKLDPYVQRLAEMVVMFQEKVDDLLVIEEEIDIDVRSIETSAYSANTFSDILNKIQKAVDDLSLHAYSNLHAWVARLDETVEQKLAGRLEAGIKAWTGVLEGVEATDQDRDMDTDAPATPAHAPGGDPQIRRQMHDIRITNQIMYLHPSIEDCRYNILQQLFAWQAVVTSQNRIQSTRYQVGLDRPVTQTYKDLLTKLPSGSGILERSYFVIEKTIKDVKSYVEEWLRYQALWDLQPDALTSKFGEDIASWMKLLNDIKKSRATFDTSESKKEFGPIVIDYAKVQSKVSLKYDSWHKDALGKFGSLLGTEMGSFHGAIGKARGDLEQQTIDAASTSDAVSFITYVQGLKRKMRGWEKQVEVYREGQRILEKQRFQFPSQWLHVDNIDGEWGAFNEIMRRKDSSIQNQVNSLQVKIIAEDKAVEGRTQDYLQDWEKNKPVEGALRPDTALQKLAIFESKYSRLKEERDNVSKAKEALELQETGPTSASEDRMVVGWEELHDLKGVWSELSRIWEQIDEMKDKPWLSVQPRKLRQQIDGLLSQLKDLPARLRQYASYEFVKKLIQSYQKVNMLIVELKSDALKDRHWKTLCKQLRVNWVLSELTLGQVWDVDLQRHEGTVKDIILVAQGEMALEEFLKQVKETWNTYELDLINYQNKCRIIRGWDLLFDKLKENINQVAAMKLSPYYKVFEEEALTWEDKLNRINALFDVWIDVQRRWVYLEGIFSGSADIKTLLPVETSRFMSISSEFLTLMKKVSKSPMVIDVLNIQGVQRSLERLADLLGKIQKALGEYLERERASFPRFYFVGDEDLLEIIGNSKNIARLQKHFKKMFAGITAILLNEDSTVITGIASKEGEEVVFVNPVSTVDYPRINEWLSQVEYQMRMSLATAVAKAVESGRVMNDAGEIEPPKLMDWLDLYPTQIVVLSAQVLWSEQVEEVLSKGGDTATGMKNVLENVEMLLGILANCVLQEQPPLRRKKIENLISEYVHKRSVLRLLIKNKADNNKDFEWLRQMRFYYDPKQTDVLKQLSIHMANAKFHYGFEYLGVQDKLVQTPLNDRCYLTMTQALEARLGGSPFGPAGTGKTETVKALGDQLGRFVLVFNCDEAFDFQAMGRIFVGLCQVGAWGCFDEFNRLEERTLSAVSQQIQTIQEHLKIVATTKSNTTVELVGKQVKVHTDMAIFITMNPTYAGRSNLPDNLKKLFRSLAMTSPDSTMIAEVTLFSQGFRTAEKLALKIVPFFKLCDEQLSQQSHYDFKLRALKSVLASAGNIKRERINQIKAVMAENGETNIDEGKIAENLPEQEILIQSVCETMEPKLVAEDIPLLFSLLNDVFPGVDYQRNHMESLKTEIAKICLEEQLTCGDSGDEGAAWMDKVIQLYQITNLHHGLMMVGPSGSGKTTAWRVLLKALERLEGVEGVSHVIDPKALSKEDLYGVLDPNTREWTDGLFTHILRKIIDNVRGELDKRQWIIFDGDVDPEWVENLNSVLDLNKLFTLPNGERLTIPNNVKIMFEVTDLKHATLATVSRCGMVWFSEDVLSTEMIFNNYLSKLKQIPLEGEDESFNMGRPGDKREEEISPTLQVQNDVAAIILPFFSPDGLVAKCLEYSATQEHIMDFTRLRALGSLFSMLNQMVRNILLYNHQHADFPMQTDQMEQYVPKSLVYSILWSFAGDAKMKVRHAMSDFIRSITTIPLPPQTNMPILDFEVTMSGDWVPWSAKVPQVEVETHKVASPDIVVPTLDTVRHESLLYTWLAEHKPMVLCGPPGSGKTMTLFSALRSLPDMEVVGLNFSSATTPELLLKTLDHYCEYRKTPNGMVLSPVQLGVWLVLFCDEINLPDMDSYGTQRVISFLRQMVEHNGFYRTGRGAGEQQFVRLERIQFVGACNPPTDPGRKPLSHRFLRHVPVVYVDYPGDTSLKQIYGTFNRAMLRMIPTLRTYADPLTNAMVEFYLLSQERFTQDMQPHYVYSPREMTRWVRGICEAIRPLETLDVEGLVRLWAHEALRLFQDRLVLEEERAWTNTNIDEIALKHFPNVDRERALVRPILFSNWLSKNYIPVSREELRDYTKARLKVFYEEELDVPLVLFNEVLDHVLRIDRIFRQPQGHLLLIGVSGAGKTTLSRFVAWMNGLTVFQIKVHNKYSPEDFDEDLRQVLRRSGCKDEKICFILDESNVMDSGFLERMNTLLANGEVPGLFEGDEHTTLMTQCKEGAQRQGLMLDTNEELYKWFTNQVMKNLHVVFTMNPSTDGLKDRAATSPALFNRCVLNWFGDWSDSAFFQVGKEFTIKMDLDHPSWSAPDYFPVVCPGISLPPNHRDAVVNAMVFVHQSLYKCNAKIVKRGGHVMAITPRHFLDFIQHFVRLYNEKRSGLEEEQLHINVGLNKIAETVAQVAEMQKSLAVRSSELQNKNEEANEKLKQMVKDQQEAEKQKQQSIEISILVEKQTKEIAIKRTEVMRDLERVEPAVIEAQNAVKSIKKQHLVEVRSMGNPAAIIRMALESICVLLGENVTDWKSIRTVTMKDNFIPSIVNFNTDDIPDETRKVMQERYLSNPDYNFEKVNRASLACGPMVKWSIAQLEYAEMLNRVDPLRQELKSLEDAAVIKKNESERMTALISQLESSITKYKDEYAQLISQAESIKSTLKTVQDKVNRSMGLLQSLGIEKDRWQHTSENFKFQMTTIIGDVFLSSAFLSYGGYFDQQHRNSLFTTWSHHLEAANISYRADLARTEFLSDPDERLGWQSKSLPTDDLCTENAIMLKRFNRYPLIIDPSGQATEFILNEYKDRKITKTSFLDDSFRKNLESALRFGNPLLVQDVENYDPILNPVLNRELRKTGGRVLITLGDQDIDLSPTFTIFLSTRDPTVEFPPDICSRVTFVNFTVTKSSLQTQCLNQVLKAERPDIDQKRSDLLKLQGEFQLRLRHLEKNLLSCLNEAKGRILDDDNVINTLEVLKTEAADVGRKVDETDQVMADIENTSKQYLPLSAACSHIYFTIESLHQVHFLYQFSLKFFLDIYHSLLTKDQRLDGLKDPAQRLAIITSNLYSTCYERVTRGMLHEDRLVFALLLTRIYLKSAPGELPMDPEFKVLLRGGEKGGIGQLAPIHGLTDEQTVAVYRLTTSLPAFKDLVAKCTNPGLATWLAQSNPEQDIPTSLEMWSSDTPITACQQSMYKLLLIQALRSDRLPAASNEFVAACLGQDFVKEAEREPDMANVVETQIESTTPILMCSVPGYDASSRVDDLAAEMNKPVTSIAIGSAEGFNEADKAINTAVRSGKWVLLKNVHLAPSWLVTLEKKLHSIQAHAGFRLFLTCEINPKLPVNLLRAGRIFTYEPPPGVRANLLRTFSTVSASRMMKPPNERARMYFLLAWFHAIVQERLRYSPLGWAKYYEFTESDLRVACDTLDTWIEATAMGRTNLPPEKVPWKAIRTLLSDCIYGGKIDNEFDQRLLSSFLEKLFVPESFERDFNLVSGVMVNGIETNIKMPDGIRRDQFLSWVEQLEDQTSPDWLGLPNNAERVLLAQRGHDLVIKLLKMQQLDEDDEELAYSDNKAEVVEGRPAWMRTLHTSSSEWLSLLPSTLNPLKRTVENIKDPLYRFFEREVNFGVKLLQSVRQDLEDVVAITSSGKKQTNHHRALIAMLTKGMIPNSWMGYKVPTSCSVAAWMTDFSSRVKQLSDVSKAVGGGSASQLKSISVWMGGLFNPEAFITATRQCVAQANSWSLEELHLDVCVADETDKPSFDDCSFAVEGLKLSGAVCRNNQLAISSEISTSLHLTRLRWIKKTELTETAKIMLPVYLNSTRQNLLFTVDLPIKEGQRIHEFHERGVAIIASSALN